MNHVPISIWRNPVHILAFGFGSGLSPVAPGTFGTVAAIPFFYLMSCLPLPWYLLILLVGFVVGIWICGKTSRDIGVHDHSGIVWDEFIGLWITLVAMPASTGTVVLGFALFRLFDVVKPWPIRTIDRRVTGGFGIMFDDVLAGIYAFCVLQLLLAW